VGDVRSSTVIKKQRRGPQVGDWITAKRMDVQEWKSFGLIENGGFWRYVLLNTRRGGEWRFSVGQGLAGGVRTTERQKGLMWGA
jgi:hypothetical protein